VLPPFEVKNNGFHRFQSSRTGSLQRFGVVTQARTLPRPADPISPHRLTEVDLFIFLVSESGFGDYGKICRMIRKNDDI